MIRSLRRKFIAVTMVIVTVLLCVIFGLVIRFTGSNLQSESIRSLEQTAQEPLQAGRPGNWQQPCFVVRVTPWGQSVLSGGGFDLSDEQMLTDIVTRAASSPAEVGLLEDYSLRYLRQERPGELTLVFADISAERETIRDLKLTCAGIGLAAVAVFWIISILLARWAVRPVERAWEEQRQFVADASHELKTPLTVIMTNAELLKEDPDPQYLRSILTMSHRMRELVEGLLELARADNGAAKAAHRELDLSALVEEELLPFEPMFFEYGLTLDAAVEPGLRVAGSEPHLRQVTGILLDNALRYSPEGAAVRVRLTRQGSAGLLTTENPGGLSREECQELVRRFWRKDKARTGGGYGLGLPIAKGIVTDHGGKIWAESREGRVLVHVQLPGQPQGRVSL